MAKPLTSTSRSNRLSDAPSAADARWDRDSSASLMSMVSPAELSVVFQPIVRIDDGSVFACEALVRCSRPEFADPTKLFEHAYKAQCVGRLGRMIREIAIPLSAGVPLFVNIHPQELREGWLVRPDDPIYFHDSDVFLEITESVPLTHFDLCLSVLREVRDRGRLHLVVDDLGAGYSNLKRIADLAPSVVKLDRGLIEGIDRSHRQRQLVCSVVRLCADLDAAVVAEGIETHSEFDALRDSGIAFGQGYLFARPSYPIPKLQWTPVPREPWSIRRSSTVPPV